MPAEVESNNTRQTATAVAVGDTVTGSQAVRDADWYAFNASAGEVVRLEFNMPGVYGPFGGITFTDSAGNVFYNARITSGISLDTGIAVSGTYYVSVESFGFSSGYSFTLSSSSALAAYTETEGNNTRATADTVVWNPNDTSSVRGLATSADDTDWFRFVAPTTGVLTLTPSSYDLSNGLPYVGGLVRVEDASGQILSAGGGRLQQAWVVAGETYYINVANILSTSSSYGVGLAISPNGQPRETENNDTRATAEVISLSATQVGQLHSQGDQDWYRFDLTGQATIAFSVQDELTLGYHSVTVFDSAGNLIGSILQGSREFGFNIDAAGTYYARIAYAPPAQDPAAYLYGMDYSLIVRPSTGLAAAPEPNNTPADANALGFGPNARVHGQITDPSDQDWVAVTTTGPGAVRVSITSTHYNGSPATVMHNGAVFATPIIFGSAISFEATEAGVYEILIDSSVVTARSSYTLEASFQGLRAKVDTPASAATPTDGLYASQWYLNGANGLDVQPVWADYTGRGVKVAILDDGISGSHTDLDGNFTGRGSYSIDYITYGEQLIQGGEPSSTSQTHGSAVAGIVAAERDGSGLVGVAYNAELVSLRSGFLLTDTLTNLIQEAVRSDVLLLPMTGSRSLFNERFDYAPRFTTALTQAVRDGREGLGTVVVTAAGDGAGSGSDTNYSNMTNSRLVLTVAATDVNGVVAGYSTPGSSILVSAPGGTAALGMPAVDISANPPAGGYSNVFGTAYAAAAVSGVVALMLEANPDLGYRDVQEILAATARLTDPGSTGWQLTGGNGWNGGGRHFSEDYGFGLVDAEAAVRLAETWTRQATEANITSVQATSAQRLNIPDNSEAWTTSTVSLSALRVEHVEITLQLTHDWIGDLQIDITSPSGTVATLVFVPGFGAFSGNALPGFTFGSTAFLGESAAGNWTLGIRDLQVEDAGVLTGWTIRAFGTAASANDTYVYTDEFADIAGAAGRQQLNDANGGSDTVNASAVSTASRIDLAGGASSIAGGTLSIAANSIETAFGGDGDDTLVGGALDNLLAGGRGADSLDGGAGVDGASYAYSTAGVTIDLASGVGVGGHAEGDRLVRIEDIIGSDFADRLAGNGEANRLTGGAGIDFLLGGAGNDILDGGAEADIIDGGDGFDIVRFGSVAGPVSIRVLSLSHWEALLPGGTVQNLYYVEMVDAAAGLNSLGSTGDDQVNGGNSADSLAGGLGNDYLAGGSGDDTLSGGAGFDWLWAGPGGDSLDGGEEKDNINGEAGDDRIEAGAGNDRITGKDGNDTISAGDGNDWVGVWNDWGEDPSLNYFPESGNDSINGDAGDDVLSSGLGTDTVDGGIGNDYVAGEQDNDSLSGGEGFDWLWAGAGADTLDGGAEKDNLNGESGNDLIWAGDGNDRICGQQDDDEIHAGNGNDWVGVWNDWGEDPALNYFPEGGNDLIFGDAGNDVLSAGFGRDTVHGGADHDYVAGEQDDDQLFGNDGIDWLWGGSGNDSMDGGAGDDHLIGESGFDRLTGGLGADVFEFRSISHSGHRILDFNAGQGDRIDVTELLFEQNYLGSDPFADNRLSREQSGADLLLRFDGTLLATIENITLAQLQTSFFIT